jgi:hypothetical protein
MNRLLTIFALLILGFSSCKRKQEDVLADIKKKNAEINNNLKEYTRKEVDDLTWKNGGNITGYYRDKEIKKIEAAHFTDTNRVFAQYYFDDGMLIYALEQNFVYNKPVTYTEEIATGLGDSVWYDDKKTRLEADRYFFNKNKLIKWINHDNADMPVNDVEFINRESQVWANAAVALKELKEQ